MILFEPTRELGAGWWLVGDKECKPSEGLCSCKEQTFKMGGRMQVDCQHLRAVRFLLKKIKDREKNV